MQRRYLYSLAVFDSLAVRLGTYIVQVEQYKIMWSCTDVEGVDVESL